MAEADARKLFQQLLVALEACHARGVANRDIKVRRRLAFQEHAHTFLSCWERTIQAPRLGIQPYLASGWTSEWAFAQVFTDSRA